MPALLSIENRVDQLREQTGCSRREFIMIAQMRSISVTDSTYSMAIRGLKTLNYEIWEKLWKLINEMAALQDETGLPVRWGETKTVVTALTHNSIKKVGYGD